MVGVNSIEQLTDKQIEEFARHWSDFFCGEVFDMGTERDKKNAIVLLRKAIKENKRFNFCYIIDESQESNFREMKFNFWLD